MVGDHLTIKYPETNTDAKEINSKVILV